MTFSPFQKKILYASVLLIAAIIMGFFIYLLFFRPAPTEYVNINGELVPMGIFPSINLNYNKGVFGANVNQEIVYPEIDEVADGGQTAASTLVDTQTQNVALANDGKSMNYYDPATGQFYRVNDEGEKELMTDEIFKNVSNVNWSHSSNKAILEFADGNKLYYDFINKKQYTLNKLMEEFTFSPTDEQIGFKYLPTDTDDRYIGIINPADGSGTRGIQKLGSNADKVTINWSPSGNVIATFSEFMDANKKRVLPLGLNGENFKEMEVEGSDFNYQYSPSGQKMIYSVFNSATNFKPSIWITDATTDNIGKNQRAIELNTWVDKCTFANEQNVYCAVPESLPTGAGLSREVTKDIPDVIYHVNTATGTKKLLAIPTDSIGASRYNIESMSVSKDGSSLFFTDNEENKIHKIKLK